MQDRNGEQVFSFRREDLHRIARLVRLRMPHEPEERRRLDRMHQVLRAASEMNRSLSTFLQHAMVDCHGTTGAADIDADAAALADAMGTFAAQLDHVTAEYRAVLACLPASVRRTSVDADPMPRRLRRHDSPPPAPAARAG